jgi:exodeoxyribonuclease VII small subunit
MATDGGKRAERPAESGADGRHTDGRQAEAQQANGRQAEGRPAEGRPGAKSTKNAADAGATGKARATATADRQRGSARAADGEGARLPYEQARDQLTELVKRLEAGGLTLEQSLELWERGERLATICEEWLEGARARLAAAIAQRSDNEPAPGTPF